MDADAIFLDTSVQIARLVHAPSIKRRIKARLQEFRLTVTSLVVRQEFKRRLLKEAKYLLEQLKRHGSLIAVLRHVTDVLPPQQARKRNICLETLITIFEHESDSDQTERAEIFLSQLVRNGLEEFDDLVDHVIQKSGCACGKVSIRFSRGGHADFGSDKCSQMGEMCGICHFVADSSELIHRIQSTLNQVSNDCKTDEIRQSESFLSTAIGDPISVQSLNPCLKSGDAVIAMESNGIPTFLTLNGKESQHFCRALSQTLIVTSSNPERNDVVCKNSDETWPQF